MPRRLITSDIFRNEKFGNLDDGGRLFFIGCFANADDDGRLKASPKYLRALIFPYDNDKTPEQVKIYLDRCQELGLVHLYNSNGLECLYCVGWEEHQVIRKDRYQPSKLPPPNSLMSTTCQPDDNQVATIGKPDDYRNPIQSNPIQSNINNKGDDKSSPPIDEVFANLDKMRGYRPPKRKAEAASILRMLKKYTPAQIIETYESLKRDKFWQDKELFMMSVESQIGARISGAHRETDATEPQGKSKYETQKYAHLFRS